MERTQVYLPHKLKEQLQAVALEDGENVSEILRQAAEYYMKQRLEKRSRDKNAFLEALHSMAGIWSDRDPEEFSEIRRSLNRISPQ